LNDVKQRQPEDVLIEMPGLFGVLAAVGKVVQTLDRSSLWN
jgi:hypothetical protein